jgi:O-antigen/teichoic acid export membrane protein
MLNFFFVGLGDLMINNLLNSQKETRVTFRRTLIFIIVGAPMGYLLIPRLGVIGLQITQLLAPKIGLFYALWWIRRNYKISINYETILKIFISCSVSFILSTTMLHILSLNPLIELIIVGLILLISYLLSILLTGVLTKQNIKDIWSIVEKFDIIKPLANPFYVLFLRLSKE